MIVTSEALDRLSALDAKMAVLLETYGPPPSWSRPPGLVALVKMTLEQQVSLDSARATYDRLHTYVEKVTTTTLLTLSGEQWRECGVSRQKARYITLLCKQVDSGAFDFDHLSGLSDLDAMTYLCQLVGVGPWTANVYLLFCLQRQDVWPSGDIALIHTIKEMYGVPKKGVDAFAQRWRPYQSLAAYCLWHRYLTDRKRTIYYD